MNPTLSPRFYPNSTFNSGWLDTVEISGKKLLYLGLCVLSLFAVIAVLYYSYVSVFGEEGKETLKHSWYAFEKFVLTNGFWLFCSIAVLPAFILPVSPLLILAGKWGGTHSPWLSCLYSVIALAVNLSWTYWFAKKPGNSMIRWLLSSQNTNFRKKIRKPHPMGPHSTLAPGVPFIFTNYILGS